MLSNSFKHTIRNLWNHRLYTSLNLLGLTIGMGAAMLIALWVQNELRFDRYHPQSENLYRINTDLQINDQEIWHWGNTPLKITDLCAQTPGISNAVQLLLPLGPKAVLVHQEELFEEEKFAYIGPGWFETFHYDFVEGDAANFGDDPHDLMLTKSLARKIFGTEKALGARLRMDSTEFVVHAVLQDPRPESSFRQNLLLPLKAWLRVGNNQQNSDSWSNFNFNTFVTLQPGVSAESCCAQLNTLFSNTTQRTNTTLRFGALTDLHFDNSIQNDVVDKGNRKAVGIFAFVGLLILLMAAINYVSLSTARAQIRAREAGIRKMVGAGKGQLFWMFLSESVVLASSAGLLALGLVHGALPWFSELTERNFVWEWSNPLPWILLGGTWLLTVIMAGIYPAVLMAGFQPLQVLRGSSKGAKGRTRSIFRQSLVVAQFGISVALLICTLVIGQQRNYIQNKEMGYDRAQVFTFSINFRQFNALGPERSKSMLSAFEQTLGQSAAIVGMSRASENPVEIRATHSGSVRFDGLPESATPTVSKISVDEQFGKVFGLELADGRWFEQGRLNDENNVILNETAAQKLGLPQPWVGQRFSIHGQEGRVIGLVRDFHFLPLREAITPLVMFSGSNWRGNYFVKTQPGQSAQALAVAEKAWKQWFPDRPFKYTFLDDDFNRLYRAEQQAGILFNLFAGIAIFIACLGLFGLATFMATQRTKEIGIRKVLGATVLSITGLLAKDFLKLVLLAILISTPLAYYFMEKWLADFAYRIELQGWVFALAGAAAIALAFITVGFQSVRAALLNPVKNLRSE